VPPLTGKPIRVCLRPSLGPHLAATSIPGRVILLDREVLRARGDFERILVHEIFHFAWVRLSNERRRNWEQILATELALRAQGELGWSAEWRKNKLADPDVAGRTSAWRHYACEAFCDTAAWRFAGLREHDEYTLPERFRRKRGAWFKRHLESSSLPV
jgi:hypothetical protein